jgi:hypothetical protein
MSPEPMRDLQAQVTLELRLIHSLGTHRDGARLDVKRTES